MFSERSRTETNTQLGDLERYYAPVKVSPGGHPQADPRNYDGETVCRSESSPCHELTLPESPPKRSIMSTICNVRMISDRYWKEVLLSLCSLC